MEIDNLVVRYGEKTAVDGLTLTVTGGTVTSVLGPNGAGKTTTMETCEGFRRPDSGQVRVLGLDPIADHDALMPRIGVMLQEGGAWSGVRALEMLRYVASLHAHPLELDPLVERLDLGSCGRTPYRRLRRVGRSSGCRWRWRSSAARRLRSWTSPPPGWTRTAAGRSGS